MNRATRSQPRLMSIVIPYGDERRRGEYVDNWLAQTYPADRYEFIAVVNPGDRMIPELRARLRDHDQIVLSDSRDLNAMYAAGIAASKGELLLLSEDHVVSETICVEQAVQGIIEHGLDGGSVAWGYINLTKTAATEELACRRDSVAWSLPDAWNTVRFRGFVIWRDVLESVGSFDLGYGLFAEASLAAKLHAAGFNVKNYGSTPMLSHVNTLRLSAVGRNTISYAAKCRAFAAHHDPVYCERYFDVSQFAHRVLASPGRLRWQVAAAAARFRFLFARRDATRLDAYSAYCHAKTELGWRIAPADGCFDFATTPAVSGSARTDLLLERLHHLCPVEHHLGVAFRWSAPAFKHQVRFDAPGSYRMHIDTGSIRGHASQLPLTLAWNGRNIDNEGIRSDERWISVEIRVETAGVGTLSATTQRLALEPATGETRALGLPICGVWFEPVLSDSAFATDRSMVGTSADS